MSAVIVGASTGLGRVLGRACARDGMDVCLVARSGADLEREAAHLQLTYGVEADWLVLDATDPVAFEAGLKAWLASRPPVTRLFLPIGASRNDDEGLLDAAASCGLLHTNLTASIVTVSACLDGMKSLDRAHIVAFGSIAAFRGRSRNVVYSAAKRALESYIESLRHALQDTGVRAHLFRLGYVDSQQSYGKTLSFPVIAPEAIARQVLAGIERRDGVRTLPAYFDLVGWILCHLPWRLYRRLSF